MLFVYFYNSRDCVVCIMARLRAGRSGLQFLTGAKELPLPQNAQIGSGAHPPSNSISTGIPSRGLKQPAHHNLVPMSRTNGDIIPVLPCAFMAWQKQLYLCLTHFIRWTFLATCISTYRTWIYSKNVCSPSMSPSLIVRYRQIGVDTAGDFVPTRTKTFYDHPYVHLTKFHLAASKKGVVIFIGTYLKASCISISSPNTPQ